MFESIVKFLPEPFIFRNDLLVLFKGKTFKTSQEAFRFLGKCLDSTETFASVLRNHAVQIKMSMLLNATDRNSLLKVSKGHLRFYTSVEMMASASRRRESIVQKNMEKVLTMAEELGFDFNSRSRARTRMKMRPEHHVLGIVATRTLIENIQKQSSKARRTLLKEALEAEGLRLRSDSGFCSSFIDGKSLATCEEVVATMRLTKWLFDEFNHTTWSEWHEQLEDAMNNFVLKESLSWSDAFEKVSEEYYHECESTSNRGRQCIQCGDETDEPHHKWCYTCFRSRHSS